MKTSKILIYTLFLSGFVVFTMTSFKKSSVGEKLTITNKTKSDIDEIHVGDSGDIMAEDEILEPGEAITIEFDCAHFHADVEATIHLIFEDDSTYSFDDTVCDGDYAWDIVSDGK
jgi:hypothetical protein